MFLLILFKSMIAYQQILIHTHTYVYIYVIGQKMTINKLKHFLLLLQISMKKEVIVFLYYCFQCYFSCSEKSLFY